MCTFCAQSRCEKCMKKSRPYPNSALDSAKHHTVRGPICKFCDRKFLVKNMIDV